MTVEGHQHRPHNSALSNKHNGDSQDNKEAALLIDDDYSRSSYTTSVSANGHILGNSNTAAVVVANDNDGGHTEGAEAPWFRGMSAEKRWTLCLTAFGNFAACTCFSLIAPFFPNEAALKGMSQTVVGVVFSCFELVFFLSAPIFGTFVRQLGPRFLFLSGLFSAGICCLLFGLLEWCPAGAVFTVLCFLLRTFLALGAASFITSSFAIVASHFPNQVATVFGTLEIFTGVGWMMGPLIGGVLFEAGGFSLPFFVLGGLLLLCSAFAAIFLPLRVDIHKGNNSVSMIRLLASPLVFICCFSIVCCSYSFGFLDATLSTHVNQFQLRATLVGLIFTLVAALYAVTSPMFGWLSDKKGITYPLIIGGNLATGVAFLLIGPSPLLPFLHTELWLVIVSLVLMGLTVGGTVIPTLTCIMQGARELKLGDGLEIFGIVSGLFNSVFHMGAFIGPTVGSALLESLGYEWSATITAGCLFLAGIAVLLYLAARRCCKCARPPEEVEKAPLVSSYSRSEAKAAGRATYGAQSSQL